MVCSLDAEGFAHVKIAIHAMERSTRPSWYNAGVRGWVAYVGFATVLLSALPVEALDIAERPLKVSSWRDIGTVNGIAQADDGFLWLATSGGLRRFDGVHFSEIDLGPGAGHRQCRRVLPARDGSIWVATGGGILHQSSDDKGFAVDRVGPAGLVRLGRESIRSFSAADGLPSDWTWALAQDAEGTVWAGTENGVVRYRDGRFSPPVARGNLPSPFVSVLHFGPDGTLWIGTAGGLAALSGGAFRATSITEPVLAVKTDQRGRVLVAIPGQLVVMDGDKIERFPGAPSPTALVVDRDGNIWVGMLSNLGRFDGNRVTTDPDPVLAGHPVISLAEDREGGVWLGTQATGLSRVAQPIVRNPASADGTAYTAFAVLAARDGSMWVTTTRGLGQFTNKGLREIRGGPELGYASRGLAQAPDGAIWVADLDRGLVRVLPGVDNSHAQITRYGTAEGLHSGRTDTIVWDARGDLWVTWQGGGVTRYVAGDFTRGQSIAPGSVGTCASKKWFVRETRDGTIWLGGVGGLSRLSMAGQAITARCFRFDDAASSAEIMDVVTDDAGSVWVATLGDTGLARLEDQRLVPLPVLPGMLGGHIFGLHADDAGHVWATTNHGVFRARSKDLLALAQHQRADLPAAHWNGETGMANQECTARSFPKVALSADAQLWVPTLQGVSVIRNLTRSEASRPPSSIASVLEEFRVDGQPVARSDRLRLSEGPHHLEMAFTAPSFVAPQRLRFAYRIAGLDGDWSPPAVTRSARYANVGPGVYQFEVRAIDEEGATIGREATLAFVIPPRLHQRPEFWVAIALLAVVAAFATYRLRLGRLAASFAAVQNERNRIARDLHDGLAQGFTSMGFILDSVRLTLPDTAAEQKVAIGQVREILGRTQEEAKRAIWSLRAEVVGRKSLQEIVEAIVKSAVVPAGTSVNWEFSGSRLRAAPLVEHELSHIVQEAMTNAIRHGRAKTITVSLAHLPGLVRLTVRDDGIGMASAATMLANGGGFGIVGMRERAMRIKGNLQMTPGPEGKGTEVTLVVTGNGTSAGTDSRSDELAISQGGTS
jgi:signal transduction histidine kinase/ligand-binding sensor domain-containing protein